MEELKKNRALEQITKSAGFELFGVVNASKSNTFPHYVDWLEKGMNGKMEWMQRPDGVGKREQLEKILSGAQSIIVLAFQYTPHPIPDDLLNDPSRGIIARYALYNDYHDIIKKKLIQIGRALEEEYGECDWKAYVDTGPILEREWAERAGLGFIGRNSNLIHYQLGSYLFLSEIIVDRAIPEHRVQKIGSCGSCTNCITNCPTGAIIDDKTIDANKCISYITIENKGAVPEWIRPLMKNRIYGCDICQEVCPWNRKPSAQEKKDFPVREDLVAPYLRDLLFFDDDSFRERFRKSPIKRAKRQGLMRNVSVALGNWGTAEAKELLQTIQKNDESELVRAHAEWAIAQCN